MPQFFIDRPVFAWVLAILITLAGVIAIYELPAESYPAIAPPQVTVSTVYPGADASTVERTVTQVIEQQLTGLDRLLYFTSTSSADGSTSISLTFETGTDAEIAAVQTQNRVALAEPRLPVEVIQQGITVAKATAGFLIAIALRSQDGSLDSGELNNIVASRVLDQIQRIPGVGSANQFGSEYAMRIWLSPDKLHAYGLSPSQVLDVVRDQNVQFASGSIGADPAVPGQQFSAPVTAEGRFNSAEQFENIILRAEATGSTVRLKDVARVGLGPEQYGFEVRYNDEPVAGFGVRLLPGANALEVTKRVKAKMAELASTLPAGVSWFVPYDSTAFILVSIKEVLITLVAAVVLVFIVMLVFLQSIRATLIPTLVVPAALMGAFIGMYVAGFSINQLSLFGMVLAIGIVVDDAIVVIEAVERIMREENLSPREATRKAMGQITGAIVTITVVLTAVFVPSALLGGATGAIYRQFALTIAVSMGFSAFLALSFTPALCAHMLKPTHLEPNVVFRWFNRAYDRSQKAYLKVVAESVRHTPRWMIAFAVLVVIGGFLFTRLPGSFLPEEDQGYVIGVVQLPAGASLNRTMQVMAHMSKVIKSNEAVEGVFQVGGFGFFGQGENTGIMFVRLKPWDDRDISSTEFNHWANGALFGTIKDATVFVVNLPTISGLGAFGGFDFFLEDHAGKGHGALMEAQGILLGKAAQNPDLANVNSSTLPDAPRLGMSVDRVQAQAMGLKMSEVYSAVQLMLAPVYANDFYYQGRVLRVLLQADAPYRMGPDALDRIYVPSSLPASAETAPEYSTTLADMRMIPLASVVRANWGVGPTSITRYNGFPAVEITGQPGPGRSSGEAMREMERIVREDLPEGYGFDWAGQSLQEILSGAQAPLLFVLSIMVVYLCLAALYESWATPVAVMLVVPLGVLGAILAMWLRGLPNDVFFKIGIITIIGLAAKNAILIVEFAVSEHEAGRSLRESVLEAARLRLRPILMTSFAFILGVSPLVVSTGAGANARRAIGTGVVGGMLSAALLGVLLVPVFYVAVRRLLRESLDHPGLSGGALPLPAKSGPRSDPDA
jgi:multidrug efflux pump